jgi:hypothetical protein
LRPVMSEIDFAVVAKWFSSKDVESMASRQSCPTT